MANENLFIYIWLSLPLLSPFCSRVSNSALRTLEQERSSKSMVVLFFHYFLSILLENSVCDRRVDVAIVYRTIRVVLYVPITLYLWGITLRIQVHSLTSAKHLRLEKPTSISVRQFLRNLTRGRRTNFLLQTSNSEISILFPLTNVSNKFFQ